MAHWKFYETTIPRLLILGASSRLKNEKKKKRKINIKKRKINKTKKKEAKRKKNPLSSRR